MLLFFALVLSDTLPADSLAVTDSIPADTVIRYQIPEVVKFSNGLMNGSVYRAIPASFEYRLADVLLTTYYHAAQIESEVFLARRGHDPQSNALFFNGHLLGGRYTGYGDAMHLAPTFTDDVAFSEKPVGGLSALLFTGKTNRYDQPYSYIRFASLSSTAVYNVDFTRAVSASSGLYFSGLFSNVWEGRENLYHKINSYYTNIYFNRYRPARLDFLYIGGAYGDQSRSSFYDVSATGKLGPGVVSFYYTRHEGAFAAGAGTDRSYGIVCETVAHRAGGELVCRLSGSRTDFTLPAGALSADRGTVDLGVKKGWNRLAIIARGAGQYGADRDFLMAPQVEAAYELFDSTLTVLSLSRGYREPALAETHAPPGTGRFAPNPALQPEFWWTREIGLRRGSQQLLLYDADYENYIALLPGAGLLQPANIDGISFTGCEGMMGFGLGRWCDLRLGGNVLLDGEPDPYLPRYHWGLSAQLKNESERSQQSVIVLIRHIGERRDYSQNSFAAATVFSGVGLIRFITLTAGLVVDNILDTRVPYTPVSAFRVRLSVMWEFWD